MDETNEAILIPIISSAIILFLAAIIITGILVQQKRKLRHQQQLHEINTRHERALLESQVKIQEETFHAISKNLHDNIGSNISTAMLLLYKDEQMTTDELEHNRLEALAMLDGVVDDLKNLARSLNTGYLDEIGLSEAIKLRLEQLERSKKYAIEMHSNEAPQRLDQRKQVLLFYIFQEAIANISKHAQAKKIWVDLKYGNDNFYMRIKDDGIGITNGDQRDGNKKGSGLINMKSHAMIMNASMKISGQNEGTEITITIPDPYQTLPNVG